MNDFEHALPGKRVAAAVIVQDAAGRMLLLKPTYRDGWLVPGGIVEKDESPAAAARREVAEETGLDIGKLEFLAVDWRTASEGGTESLHFVFRSAKLTAQEAGGIRLSDEHSELRFLDVDEALLSLNGRLRRRLEMILKEGRTGYLESAG